MTPSMTESDPLTGKPTVEFALGQRQIAAIGFVAVLLLGCVATMAYVAGRAISPGGAPPVALAKVSPSREVPPRNIAEAAPGVVKRVSSAKVEQLIMVEPAAAVPGTGQPSIMAAKAAEPPVVPQATPAKQASPELKPLTAALLAGNTFWQVAATDLGMAQVTCELLTRKGLPAILGDSPSPGIYRVLVGPVHTPEESTRHKAGLDEAGFHPFIKKY